MFKEIQPNKKIIDELVNLYRSGKLNGLEAKIENYIKKFPQSFTLYNLLGAVFAEKDQLEKSEYQHRKSIKINPNYAEGYNNLGIVLQKLKKFDDAIIVYKKAIKIKPDFDLAYNNLAKTYKYLKNFNEAIIYSKKAIELKTDFAEAYNTLGTALSSLEKLDDSYKNLKRAIEIKPDYVEAHANLGNLFKKLGNIEKCVESYQRAIEINPNYYHVYSNLLFNLLYHTKFDYKHYIKIAKKFRASLKKIPDKLCAPFVYDSNAKKIKIGFVSADFRQHPVGYFLRDAIKELKKKNLELIAYSNNKKKDSLSFELQSHFNNWYEISDINDLDLINQIRNDGVHILFDLSGHSSNNRLPIFINKPAPVQVTWVGFAGSTGIPEIDYIFGDKYITPLDSKEQFVETIFHLPNIWCCFSQPDIKIIKNELTPASKNGFITFGSFNNYDKFNENVIKIWSKILRSVPNSKLILKNPMFKHEHLKNNIKYMFEKNNIGKKELILEEGSPRKELLESYNKIDIALDTFPYSGATTSFESILMGVPVLTIKGNSFVSRTTESLNKNCGMLNWIANNENDYISKAIQFSKDIAQLSKIKKNLRETIYTSPLFDAKLFADQLNNSVWEIWKNYLKKKNS